MTNTRRKLAGTTWVVESIGGKPVEVADALKPLQLTLSDKDQRVAAHGGVNRFGGTYTAEGDELRFGPLVSTKMAGTAEMNQQEQAFADALAKTRGYRVEGETLILRGETDELVRLVAKRPEP